MNPQFKVDYDVETDYILKSQRVLGITVKNLTAKTSAVLEVYFPLQYDIERAKEWIAAKLILQMTYITQLTGQIKMKFENARRAPIILSITNSLGIVEFNCPPYILEGVVISQQRERDNDKTDKRLVNDVKVLERNQEDPRNVFYLAQTYFGLKRFEDSKKYYLKRLTMTDKKILDEEVYLSHFRLGDIETVLEQHFLFAIKHYENAYDYSCRLYKAPRAEPLYAIAQAYKYRNPFVSLDYIRRCCDLPDTNALLLVNKQIYDIDRWEFMRVNIEVVKGLAPDNNKLCETLGYDINTLKPILCPK